MAKSEKVKKTSAKKTTPKAPESVPGKTDSKSRKEVEEDEEDEELELVDEKPVGKNNKVASRSKKEEDDDDDEDVEEVEDEWEKVEEEDQWDPDFDEFDIPKSKTKKATGKKAGKEEDDLGIDEEFKDMGFFDDAGGYDDDDEDF